MQLLYAGKQNLMQNKELQTLCYGNLALSLGRIALQVSSVTRYVYHISTGKQQEDTSYSGPNTNFPQRVTAFLLQIPNGSLSLGP